MKRLLILLLCIFCVFSVTACEDDPTLDTPPLPEGAVRLTTENIEQYFDIKVTSKCELSYDTDNSEAECISSAFVALVPKENYRDASGEISYDVNCEVYSYTALFGRYKIVNTEQSLRIKNEITNEAYTSHSYTTEEYHPDFDTNTITIKSVTGYVVPGTNEDGAASDGITDAQRAGSPAIKAELEEKINVFKELFRAADNYAYLGYAGYTFHSIYGEGMSVSGGGNRYGAGSSTTAVDCKNQILVNQNGRYFVLDGTLYEQKKNSFGFIEQRAHSYSFDDMTEYEETLFDALTDPNAIYIRDGAEYAAYVSLKDMTDSVWRDEIIEDLTNYGITTGHGDFVVRYEYGFDGSSFSFDVILEHRDTHYPVHFFDISSHCGYKISDLNNQSPEKFEPKDSPFALSTTLEDAVKFNLGMIEIDGTTESLSYTAINSHYGDIGQNVTDCDNFLPVKITEGGVYVFRDENGNSTRTIYDSYGKPFGDEYFTAGIYYIMDKSVIYGTTARRLTVEATILDDYGSLDTPIPIENDSISCLLECGGDRVVYSYVPNATGFYQLALQNDVYITVYEDGNLEDYTKWICTPDMSVYFEGGKEYVLSVQHRVHPADVLEYSTDITYIGDVSETMLGIAAGSTDAVLLGADNQIMYIDVLAAGEYIVENKNQHGESVYAYFCDEDGKSSDIEEYENANGDEVYFLDVGRYYYYISTNENGYFLGSVMLTLSASGVCAEYNITLSYDEYTTNTTPLLPTKHSYAIYYFEITEASNLMVAVNSDGCLLFTEDGAYVPHTVYPTYMDGDVEVTRYMNLKPGKYYILAENRTNAPREYTFTVKLQKKES